MSDLDEKLHDLLYKEAESYYFEGSSPEWFEKECPELIGKFKQAFKDASYIKVHLVDEATEEEWEKNDKLFGLMSGQEWYDKFTKTLGELTKDEYHGGFVTFENVDKAASRAAGIE